MRRLLLAVILTLGSGAVLAEIPTVDCAGCVSLRDFGNFGAAQLFRATGALSATVGNDRVWVVNPASGQQAFVDIDTPVELVSIMGFPTPIPDYTQIEINATWDDGSSSAIWALPNEVVAAIGESLDVAEVHETPEITEEELPYLPGFDDAYIWQIIGAQGTLLPTNLLFGLWSFSVFYGSDGTVGTTTVYECAWSSAC